MDLFSVFSAFGLSASAGLNAYIPLLVIALLGRFTNLIHLNSPWNSLTSWWIIGLLVILSIVEFFADKIPAVNHVNDIIQTFIRPTAGAIAFASSSSLVSGVHPALALGAGLLIAGSVHAVKAAAVRPAVTVATAGAGNIPVSILEDVVSTGLSILSVIVPVVIASLLVLFTAWVIWLLWRRARRTALQA